MDLSNLVDNFNISDTFPFLSLQDEPLQPTVTVNETGREKSLNGRALTNKTLSFSNL